MVGNHYIINKVKKSKEVAKMDVIKHKAKLSSKYQITIPKAIREELNLTDKDKVEFNILENGTVQLKKAETDDKFWSMVMEQQKEYGSIATNEVEWGEDQGAEIID